MRRLKDPNITIDQLLDELQNPVSHTAPGVRPEQTHAHDVLDVLSQKLMRVLRDAKHKAEKKPALKQRLDELELQWGVAPEVLHKHLRDLGPQGAADYLRQQSALLQQIEGVRLLVGSLYMPILSGHKDELMVREQINQSAALAVIVNRPKDLTREQLREVRLLLDRHGFSEAALQSAWRNRTNQEIATSIIGYIRQAALGEALLPFEQRVAQAMQRIYSLTSWTPIQRKWLERLAKQLTHEVVIDTQFVNRAFASDGGANRLDKLLAGQLPDVLGTLADALWPQAA